MPRWLFKPNFILHIPLTVQFMNFIYCFLLFYARDPRGIRAFHSVLCCFSHMVLYLPLELTLKCNCSYYTIVFFCTCLVVFHYFGICVVCRTQYKAARKLTTPLRAHMCKICPPLKWPQEHSECVWRALSWNIYVLFRSYIKVHNGGQSFEAIRI